jgi:hypothetical protein
MRMETFISKSLGMKAHTVVQVKEQADGGLVTQVDRLPGRQGGDHPPPRPPVAGPRPAGPRSLAGLCALPRVVPDLRPPGGADPVGREVAAGHPRL